MKKHGCLLHGSNEFMEQMDLHPWHEVVHAPNEWGKLQVGVMNTTDDEIRIEHKTLYTPHLTGKKLSTNSPWDFEYVFETMDDY